MSDVAHQLFHRTAHGSWDFDLLPIQEPYIPANASSETVDHGNPGITHRFGYNAGQLVGTAEDVNIPYFRYLDGSAGSDLFEASQEINSALWADLSSLTYDQIQSHYVSDTGEISIERRVRDVDVGFLQLGLGNIELDGGFVLRAYFSPANGTYPDRFHIYEAVALFEIDDIFDYDYFNTVGGIPIPLEAAELQCGYGVHGNNGGQVFGVRVDIRRQIDVGAGIIIQKS